MAKDNRTCYTCGKGYHYCPSCPADGKKEAFYNMFCSERCSRIFKALTDQTFKTITTLQCKDELLRLNVTVDEDLKDSVKNHISKVFSYIEENNMVEEIIIDNTVEENFVDVLEEVVTEPIDIIIEEEPVINTDVLVEENLVSKTKNQYASKKHKRVRK